MATHTVTATQTHAPIQLLSPQDKSKRISPDALCHVVLRTSEANYDRMIDYYLTILGGNVSHQSHRLSFIAYDYEHHRIAIVKDLDATARVPDAPPQVGMHHMAFGYSSLQDLAMAYNEKKEAGIVPFWCVNHGVTTSMYYADPDGNRIEFQVDNFDTAQESVAYMKSKDFEKNPVGVEYDPEVLLKRLESGEDDKSIKKRPHIGLRDSAGV